MTEKPKGLAKIWREAKRPFKKIWREVKRPVRQVRTLLNFHDASINDVISKHDDVDNDLVRRFIKAGERQSQEIQGLSRLVGQLSKEIATLRQERLPPTGYLGLDFSNVEQFESDVLLSIDTQLQGSEMSRDERLFLNGIIRKARPKKIVEYGVSAGGSAAVMLNSIKDIPDAKLYSLDYSEYYYVDKSKPVGWMVPERFPHLADKWECLAGGVCCQFLDRITDDGKEKIDVCLIDTAHLNPGEFLNILEVLPYMSRNGIIIMHDTALHTLFSRKFGASTTTCVCLNTLHGKRIILWEDNTEMRPFIFNIGGNTVPIDAGLCPIVTNIGGIVLDDNVEEMLYPLFANLSLPWMYSISEMDYNVWLEHFQRHYSREFYSIFERAYRFYSLKKS